MKLSYKEVKEAHQLHYDGVQLASLAIIFDTSLGTISRYIRAYERYGKSFWGPFPTEKEDG